jgi:ABC-type Fe3+ transport system permease subunit
MKWLAYGLIALEISALAALAVYGYRLASAPDFPEPITAVRMYWQILLRSPWQMMTITILLGFDGLAAAWLLSRRGSRRGFLVGS